jgi:surface antigen
MHRLTPVIAALLLTSPAMAANMISVFKDAPITRLNADEVKQFEAFVHKALDEGKEGETREWKAPKTEFTSKVTTGKDFEDGKLKCREAVVDSEAHDRSQRGRYSFCKTEKGAWVFKSPTKPQPAKK